MVMRARILLIILLLSPTYEKNPSLKNTTKEKIDNHSEHYLVKWKVWHALSVLGCLGTPSNLLIVYTFYSEENMATSVNAMIIRGTLYSLVYTVIMHWRNYNLVQDTTLFSAWFTREQVNFKWVQSKCNHHSTLGLI
jgi:hypothetical protein